MEGEAIDVLAARGESGDAGGVSESGDCGKPRLRRERQGDGRGREGRRGRDLVVKLREDN